MAVISGIAIAGLLGVRLRQLIVQAIVVEPRPGIERFAVVAGQALVVVAFVAVLAGLIGNFVGGGSTVRMLSGFAAAGFWVGLGRIELVIANSRSAVMPTDQRPSGTARFFVSLFNLLAGVVIGVPGVFGVLFMTVGH